MQGRAGFLQRSGPPESDFEGTPWVLLAEEGLSTAAPVLRDVAEHGPGPIMGSRLRDFKERTRRAPDDACRAASRGALARRAWERVVSSAPRSHGRGTCARAATTIFTIGPPFQADKWYRIQFEWSYRAPKGHVAIHVDDRAYESEFEFVPGTIGPGRFYLFGHVETRQPEGRLHFRNFKVR